MPVFYPDKMQQDFRIFRQSLEEAHPGLYRYTTRPAFSTLFDSVSKQFNTVLTEQQFYSVLKPIITRIKCSHTKLNVANKSDTDYPYNTDKLFPVEVYFSDNKAFALHSFADSVLVPAGAEITEINGEKMTEIITKLRPFVSAADGYSKAAFYRELGENFSGYYAAFMQAAPEYTITYQFEGKTKTVSQKAVGLEQVKKHTLQHAAFQKFPDWSLKFENSEIAILTLNTFETGKFSGNYKEFLKEAFTRINNSRVNNLIIDLRENASGADENGALLYSYLTSEPFRFYRQINTNTNKQFTFIKQADVPWYFAFYRRLLKMNPDSTFRYTYHENLKIRKHQENSFVGNVYVLVNGGTNSAASDFTAIASSNKRVTVVGEETAGAMQGGNRGMFTEITLPNSKFKLTIPLWAYVLESVDKQKLKQNDIPVKIVKPAAQDKLKGVDKELKFTLDLIDNAHQKKNQSTDTTKTEQ